MLTFLLVIQAIVAVLLVGVILMQQSEGGGLGMGGGSPSGLMSARGAADFLTRATTVLAAIFISLSIVHAVLATQTNRGGNIDTSLAKRPVPQAPAPTTPTTGAPAPAPMVPLANTPPSVPIATAQPKAQPRSERTRPIPRAAESAPGTTAPPRVAATVPTPAPSTAPVQGPPANSN